MQVQWPFWNLWIFSLVPGFPSSHLYSVVSKRRAPPPHHPAPNPDSGTESSTNSQDLGPCNVVGAEEEDDGPLPV